MNATATKGIWQEKLSEDVVIQFDTTRNPERISIQKRGLNPIHIEREDGITENDVIKAKDMATVAYLR